MHKKDEFVDLTKIYNNDVHNESFENKKPKKKMYGQNSTELKNYTEENTCEKDIEQNIIDSYSRKDVNQKRKAEINALADISLENKWGIDNVMTTKKPKKKKNHNKSLNSIEINSNNDGDYRTYEKDNDHTDSDSTKKKMSEINALADISLVNKWDIDNDNVIATKKPKKKKNHNKSLNSIEINSNNDGDYRTYEKDNDHTDSDSTKKKMSEINALATKKHKKNKSLDINEAEIKSFERTCEEVSEPNINGSHFRENVKKLSSKKNYIRSLNLIELNAINDAELKSLAITCKEVHEQNIIDSSSSKNVNRKRKSEITSLADISLGDDCSISNENVPTKKRKKKKNHDGSLNSIELNTNHDTEIQIFERTHEEVNNFDNSANVTQIIRSALNASSNISLKNKLSMDNNNVVAKKPKKEKKHNKSFNLTELNNINDSDCQTYEKKKNAFDSTENISQKIMSETNASPTKKPKKKKNHNESFNPTELDTNHDKEIQILEKTFEEDNDSDYRQNVNQRIKSKLNTSTDIFLEDKCSMDTLMDTDNVKIKKPYKKKKHNRNLNSIKNNLYNDTKIQIFERTDEEVDDSDNSESVIQIIRSELNSSSNISFKNKCSMDDNNAVTKKSKKEKKHNKSLNSIELNTNIDAYFKTYEKKNEININGSDSKENIIQNRMSEFNALEDIGKDCNNANENIPTKNHNNNFNSKDINTNHDTEIKTFKRTCKEVSEPMVNDSYTKELSSASLEISYSLDDENIATKESKKRKKLSKNLNPIESNTINDANCQTYEKNNEQKINALDFTENISQKIISETNASPTKKPKKKKNHNESFYPTELDTNHDKEIQILEKTFEEHNDSDYRQNVNQRIKSKLNTSTDIFLEDKCSMDTSMDTNNVKIKKPYKKKKHNRNLNSIKNNLYNDTKIQMFERTDEEVDDSDNSESVIQIIRSELNSSSNISLKNKCSMDDNNAVTKKSKKEKKHNKSLNSIELNTNIDAYFKTYEKNNEININGSNSKENIIQNRMSELNALEDIGKDCNNANENIPTKNHNNNFNSKDINTNHDTEIKTFKRTCKEVSEPKVNDSNTKELSSASLEISYSLDDENIATKDSKKRKKLSKHLNPIESNTINDADFQTYEKNNEQKINALDFTENISQKIISEINASPTKKPKKKKNHNKSFNPTELDTNHDKEIQIHEKMFEEVNDSDYIENVNQRMKSKLNTLTDIFLEDKCDIDTDNVATKKPKKNKKHNKSLNSVDINTDYNTELKTFERTCKEVSEPKMNDSDAKELSSASLEISYSLDDENISTKESKKRKMHNISKTVTSDCTNENKLSMISQNQGELKTLLSSMEMYNSEESSTIDKTNFNLKRFDLIKYLTNKDPSLINHPNFKQIIDHLSKKIKLTINTKCELGTSDILLLKTVGKIILKKIVEKINSAQDIKDLVIKLPAESQKNKIHFVETTLSRLPNKLTMEIIKKQNPLIKLRVFNKDEDKMIREYWSKFQKEYNISNILPFLSNGMEMTLSPRERLQFIRYISAGLPNRLLYSVFNRFNILFNEYQDKTSFSEEEDQLIIKVDKCDAIRNKFSVLSLILNRTRLQLYRRIEVLRNQPKECKKVVWDDQKRQELFTNILLETNTEHWKHLKSLTITKDIWIKIAKNLGEDFTHAKVKSQWNYIYTMLFCEKPILRSTFNLTTLDLLEQINAKHWSDLDWTEITNKLYPGANSKVICMFFYSWIHKKVPSNIKGNIRDSLNYLQLHEVDKLKRRIDEHGEREYPRLTVKHFDLLVNNNQ